MVVGKDIIGWKTREVLSHGDLRRVLSCTLRKDGKYEYDVWAFRDYSSLEEALKDHEEGAS